MTTFFGLTLTPGKLHEQEVEHQLQVTMAALNASNGKGQASLWVKNEKREFLVCSLNAAKKPQERLELSFGEGEAMRFLVKGDAKVYLTGYLMPLDEEDDFGLLDEEDDEEEEEPLQNGKRKLALQGKKAKKAKNSDDEEIDSDDLDALMNELDEEDSENDDDLEDEEEEQSVKPKQQPKKEQPKKEQPKKEQPKKEQPKKEQPKKEQPKKEQPKKEQPKKQEATAKAQAKEAVAKQGEKQTPAKKEAAKPKEITKKLPNGLVITDVIEGSGPEARKGKFLHMNYVGKLTNNKIFDQTGKKPFAFRLGMGEVIKGWDQGIQGMKVGGKRRLVIPSTLAYGKSRVGDIPQNSTLIFDVELKSVSS